MVQLLLGPGRMANVYFIFRVMFVFISFLSQFRFFVVQGRGVPENCIFYVLGFMVGLTLVQATTLILLQLQALPGRWATIH